tara:strand:- start:66963 stop:67712 length:750 start_codon:yes stop_codon:yes gene_type:complete
MNRLTFFLALIIASSKILAQDIPIFTDRPNVTDAVPLISPGTFQVELGYANTQSGSFSHNTVPNLSVKYGLVDWLELRVLTNYAVNKIELMGAETQRGITPITFSPKFGLTEQDGAIPRTSLVTNFTFPNVGAEAYQLDELNYGFRLLFEYGFGKFTWTNSTGTDWPKGFDQTWAFTTVGGYALTDKLSTWLELFGTFNDDNGGLGFDFGLAYLVSPSFQVDIIYGNQIGGTDYQLIGFGGAWKTNFKE